MIIIFYPTLFLYHLPPKPPTNQPSSPIGILNRMAKSTRSKVKRTFRAKKRTEGVYAAVEAARLQRLNAKLRMITTTGVDDDDDGRQETRNSKEEGEGEDHDQDVRMSAAAVGEGDNAEMMSSTVIEGVDGKAAQKFKGKVSTHGPRGSRREQWRVSKGMTPRAKSRGLNRQGSAAARYKSGRPHRRR